MSSLAASAGRAAAHVDLDHEIEPAPFVADCDVYADPSRVAQEMEYTRRICRRGRFTVRDVSGAPIETTSRHLIELLDARFGDQARGGGAVERPRRSTARGR